LRPIVSGKAADDRENNSEAIRTNRTEWERVIDTVIPLF